MFLWSKIHRCMVGLSALCVGVRIYGDVWRSGAYKPLIWDRSVRELGELVAVVHVFHTSSSLYTYICRINMGICILEYICMHICYRYVRVYWYDGVLDLCLCKATSWRDVRRLVGRTRNLKGSAWVGVGGVTHLWRRIQEKREALVGRSIHKQILRHTFRNTHRHMYRHTHRHTHSLLSISGCIHIYLGPLDK